MADIERKEAERDRKAAMELLEMERKAAAERLETERKAAAESLETERKAAADAGFGQRWQRRWIEKWPRWRESVGQGAKREGENNDNINKN